ncbi:hypothetical protein FRX31_008955 [Thalictrum thalictroides]|uniref:Uncharacterized protein n=1 Tax=Thalictrum thalictroides TaxID=46969 RepID=A0A7J6WVN1_THATH|nr:hypothetical protein FRX31_008955 [Thalictrum thalictroides]
MLQKEADTKDKPAKTNQITQTTKVTQPQEPVWRQQRKKGFYRPTGRVFEEGETSGAKDNEGNCITQTDCNREANPTFQSTNPFEILADNEDGEELPVQTEKANATRINTQDDNLSHDSCMPEINSSSNLDGVPAGSYKHHICFRNS